MWGWLYNILKVTLAVSSTVKEFDQNSAVKTTFINKLGGITRSHKKQVMIFLNLFFFIAAGECSNQSDAYNEASVSRSDAES